MGDLLAAPHLSADLDDFAGATHRRVEWHAVEALHHLRTRRPDAQPEPAVGDVVQAGGRHRQQCGCPGVNRKDTRPEFDGGGLRGEIAQLADRIVGVRLGDQSEIDTLLLQHRDLLDAFAEAARI